ncbi:arginyl-tRNA synthetase [Ignicoccus pacificus DSM 13166]|uniref:Arginine--tRNA ligase n=1 Tax=Ignicoccus pacificus DSM 13166 TaxID=940294 RepID=A0A977PKE0_9CREN|nr:arginyl-tRNA synthetase [Ignicoccus pacificus DSM 13166]
MYALVDLKNEFIKKVKEALKEKGVEADELELLRSLAPPPSPELGDWGVPLFKYAKMLKMKPYDLVKELSEKIKVKGVKELKAVGGYLNAFVDVNEIAKRLLEEAIKEDYGTWNVPGRRVVEHTSANPVHPLHIGHVRNMFLGDSLAKILKNYGNEVQTRFYVNDVGRQVTVLVYALLKMGRLLPPEEQKPDHWYGIVYSVANAVIESKGPERDEWVPILEELRSKYPEIVKELEEKLKDKSYEEINKEISDLMKRYENKEEEAVKAFRTVVNKVIDGFKESMEVVGVRHDVWDWESELVWSGMVDMILKKAKELGIAKVKDGALVIEFNFLNDEIRERLRIPKGLEIPPLVLVRSDGTTLYTTRDIAYTIKKFEEFNADEVINVIATEQRLPQAQLRLALWALGYKRYAENLIHYAYEMVNIPGMKMSGRRGRMITLDWLVDEAIKRVKPLVEERSVLQGEEREKIARVVAVGAIKYAMVSVSKDKPITFKWNEVLNFERSSAPYIQYTHARAVGILRKANEEVNLDKADFSKAEAHRELILKIGEFPEVTRKAAEDLAPEKIAVYLSELSDLFNKFYHEHPVSKEPDEGYKQLKLAMVKAVANTLRRGLDLLGIEAPERM